MIKIPSCDLYRVWIKLTVFLFTNENENNDAGWQFNDDDNCVPR